MTVAFLYHNKDCILEVMVRTKKLYMVLYAFSVTTKPSKYRKWITHFIHNFEIIFL